MIITEKKIRILIKKLLESNLTDLEKRYKEDIIQKNSDIKNRYKQKNLTPNSWDFLDYTANILRSLDKPDPKIYGTNHFSLGQKIEKVDEILRNDLGFKKVGFGAFREVYAREDVPFIVKLEAASFGNITGSNSNEYDKYFNYGPDNYPRNDLFTKIYAYDHKDSAWIIFEKVNVFSPNNKNLVIYDMFAPFINFLSKILNFIMNDSYYSKYYNRSNYLDAIIKKDESYATEIFHNIITFIEQVSTNYKKTGDLQEAFINTFINLILIYAFGKHIYSIDNPFTKMYHKEINEQNKFVNIFKKRLSDANIKIKITPDISYICNFLKNDEVKDLHIGNVGYRNDALTTNKNKPWESFVILDFGEFGNLDKMSIEIDDNQYNQEELDQQMFNDLENLSDEELSRMENESFDFDEMNYDYLDDLDDDKKE